MTQPEAMISLRHVSKRFGDLIVLDDVSFDFPKGMTTVLLGPSGTGKSVLLKHIVGLLTPDAGEVLVEGVDMAQAGERVKAKIRKRFGMLFQDGALFDNLTAGENVAFPLLYHTKLNAKQRQERAQRCLEMVELPSLYDRPTAALSGGQRKRVGLARAIVLEPEVVLFDEPNSGLDPMTSDTIDELIVKMKTELGITFIVITHDIVQALAVGDYIGMLYQGHLIEYGPKADFLRSRQRIVRDFLKRNVSLEAADGPLIEPP